MVMTLWPTFWPTLYIFPQINETNFMHCCCITTATSYVELQTSNAELASARVLEVLDICKRNTGTLTRANYARHVYAILVNSDLSTMYNVMSPTDL